MLPNYVTDPRIIEALLIIEQENNAPLISREVAKKLGLSEFYFNRLFKEQTGITVAYYIRCHRLRLAAIRLSSMPDSLDVVAKLAGYSRQQAFNRAFTQHYGVTPLKYRKGHRSPETVATDTWKVAEDTAPPVRIVTQPAIRWIRRRYYGPYTMFPQHWLDFITSLPELLRQPEPDRKYIGFIHDSPGDVPPEQIRYDCGLVDFNGELAASLTDDDRASGLIAGETRAGTHAYIEHVGSYKNIGVTYSLAVHHWVHKQSRYTYTEDPALEIYDDPLVQLEHPDSLRIDCFLPMMVRAELK